MPITPLHLGPGLVFKAGGGNRVSLVVFAFAQVMMDIEVLVRIALDAPRLHGFTNTITGATVVLVPSVLIGRRLGEWMLGWWNRHVDPGLRRVATVDPTITRGAAWAGGILGVYSHWLLDAMMHYDAEALWPFVPGNPLLPWMSVSGIHTLCFATGTFGVVMLVALRLLPGRRRG